MTNQIVKPVVPVDFLQDLFAQCGSELLGLNVARGYFDKDLVVLAGTIFWFNRLKALNDLHGGIPAKLNDQLIARMVRGLNAMWALEGVIGGR